MTENLEFWNNLLSSGVISAVGSLVFKMFSSPNGPIGPRIAHPIARFIVQAKKRDADGRNVTKISVGEWEEHYPGGQSLQYIDGNAALSSTQYQIFSGDAIPHRREHQSGSQSDIAVTATAAEKRYPEFRNCVFVDRGLWNENNRG